MAAGGRGPRPHRRSALRYAAGITVLQVVWVLRLFLPEGPGYAGFLVLVAGELAVPVWAERPPPPPGTRATSPSATACSP